MREPMLILHFIGLAMVLGAAIGLIFQRMGAAEESLAQRSHPLMRMANWGLIVMFISGGALMTGLWGSLGSDMLLLTKLLLFLVLAAFGGIISGKMRKAAAGDAVQMAAAKGLSNLFLLVALVVVVLAVLRFQ